MNGLRSWIIRLAGAVLVTGTLSLALLISSVLWETPRAEAQEKALLDKTAPNLANPDITDETQRIIEELDAARAEIKRLKAAGFSTSLPQPELLASKIDANDPLRSAYPIQKKLGLRLAQVHFDPSSSQMSPGGIRLTREAAEWIKMVPGRKIIVAGFADRTGSSEANREVSFARAQSVVSVLEGLGIPADAITIKAMGEEKGPEPTEDGAAEPLNRCAAIFLAY